MILISCIIPASPKDYKSQNLVDLIDSIKAQDFPQDQIEILVITEGDSESAKAIGIRQAQGEICAMFCADNEIVETDLFKRVYDILHYNKKISGVYPHSYAYVKSDNSLNRYFSLIGGNDPVCYYLGKNDRNPHVYEIAREFKYKKSYGCNGFFYQAEDIKKTDLDNYYPMDNATEVKGEIVNILSSGIWHKTSDKLIPFLKKRYKYARDLYCNRNNRRWRIIDGLHDHWRLLLFVFYTASFIEPLLVSIRGFRKIKDPAWFWHLPVCWGFLITYGVLTLRTFWYRLSSRLWADLNPFRPLSKA